MEFFPFSVNKEFVKFYSSYKNGVPSAADVITGTNDSLLRFSLLKNSF